MTTQLDNLAQRPANSRLGQATAVEQSRAIAQVQAQIVVAQQMPRDMSRAVSAMHRSCAQKGLADQAFYSFKRAGQHVSGPSVQLARELARCFGNMEHGIAELVRDDGRGQSEMMAFAWDLETNTRSSTIFIVPHRRDRSEAKGGSVVLTEMRDIYENNANHGARRLREMIFAVLPGWYTEDAVAACYETLQSDETDGKTHAERTHNAIERFKVIGVTGAQLEARIGAPSTRWSPYDLAQLGVLYRSIQRGETRKEDEFSDASARVTVAEITGQSAKDPGPAAPDGATASGPAAGPGTTHATPSKAATEKLTKLLRTIPLGDGEDVTALLAAWTGRPDFLDTDMTAADVKLVTGILESALKEAGDNPELAASHIWAARNKSGEGDTR